MRNILYLFYLLGLLFLFGGCSEQQEDGPNSIELPIDSGSGNTLELINNCSEATPPPEVPIFDLETVFNDWRNSKYKLPYKVGETFFVNQGNNSGFGHSEFWKYGYDFTMKIGTEVYAARSGTVLFANDGAQDGDSNRTNLVVIEHGDKTVALYSHLTRNGVLVNVGDQINQGELIGLSGNTGNTGGLPHLHFSVHPCGNLPGLASVSNCPSQPITFRNTEANPNGLGTWRCYTAL